MEKEGFCLALESKVRNRVSLEQEEFHKPR
jgi:hypothetical protein